MTDYLEQPRSQAEDQIKKILVYTLLMRGGKTPADLYNMVADSPWYGETIDLFLQGQSGRKVFEKTVGELIGRGAISAEDGFLKANVPS